MYLNPMTVACLEWPYQWNHPLHLSVSVPGQKCIVTYKQNVFISKKLRYFRYPLPYVIIAKISISLYQNSLFSGAGAYLGIPTTLHVGC